MMSKFIELPDGQKTIIDDVDYEKVSAYRWHLLNGYAGATIKSKEVYLHRFILNAKPGKEIDHINGNTLDNRRSNLRICLHIQNSANKPKHSNNKSGFKGVYWNKNKNRYRAQICVRGIPIHLGYFYKPDEGASAYNIAAKKYFGEFAKLNFGDS